MPNLIRWNGAWLTEPVTFVHGFCWTVDACVFLIHMCANIYIPVGGNHLDGNQWPSFLPLAEIFNELKEMPVTFAPLPFSSFYRTNSRPLRLFIVSLFSSPLLPLPSLFSLCYTVERWKSFLYPTHHRPVTINSIYVCLNWKVCKEHAHHPLVRACTHTHRHGQCIVCVNVFPAHTHTGTHIWSHPSSP